MKLPKEREEKGDYQTDIYKARVKIAMTIWETQKHKANESEQEISS